TVVVMFQDFSMKTPQQILQSLLPPGVKYTPHLMAMPIPKATSSAVINRDPSTMAMNNSSMQMSSDMKVGANMKMNHPIMSADLNDVKYDAYLVNYHSPADPQITKVKAGTQVKLRFINGASASNFWVNLGKLNGTLVAVDGQDIKPIKGNKFQIAMAQRLDVIISIPKQGGTFPILGQVEGLKDQTGIILSTLDKPQPKYISSQAAQPAAALDYHQELQLHSLAQASTFMDKPVILNLNLTGDMKRYTWQINGQMWPHITPLQVKQGQNVIMVIQNSSMMAHPMHLHGYDFKVVNIDGKPVNGALHDTILVLPYSKVTVEFAADYSGKWVLHCHTVYHMATGMMTYLEVEPKSF
ncbi:MAG: multicopper oxidase domain-containing protein, partial [Burkholderiales bacterium]|nr:multicopper oxidase domain-containing protein [Burkholderiales bacterium]